MIATLRFPTAASFMPSRLTRYVMIEILKIFIVSLVALTLLILLIGVGRELLRRGLGLVAIIQLLPFVLPISLQFAFPATALFSVCCVYGRMAADGEVATVKATGISPLTLLQPAIIFAALLSPAAVYFSDLGGLVGQAWCQPRGPDVDRGHRLSCPESPAFLHVGSRIFDSCSRGLRAHADSSDGDGAQRRQQRTDEIVGPRRPVET